MQVVSSREEFQWLLLIVMGFLLSLLPESFLWIGCLSVVLLIGVPHGALDIYLLWFNDTNKKAHFIQSLCRYLFLVFGALAVWKIYPDLFWGIFFATAIYHFGSSDEHPEILAAISGSPVYRVLWILSRGTLLVFAPAAFHPLKITYYLSQAASAQFSFQMTAVAPFLCSYAGLFFLWATYRCWKKSSMVTYRWILIKHFITVLVLLMLFAVADPLLSFSLYFCCHHSLAHTFRVWSRMQKKIKKSYLVLWAVVTTFCVTPLLWWIPKQMLGGATPAGMVTACFVAIAALTFPHLMVVNELHGKMKLR